MSRLELHLGDCLHTMRGMADNSVDLILTDPPYFKVKDEPWDNQWAKPQQFLAWLDTVLQEFQRILKPNGSIYLFASPQMATRVETLIAQRFDVLNSIRWYKESGWHRKQRKEDLRTYLQPWEAVLFAEHRGAELFEPKGQPGYRGELDKLKAKTFAPLRAYMDGELQRSGLDKHEVNKLMGFAPSGMASSRYFGSSQWQLPTATHYESMRAVMRQHGDAADSLPMDYADVRAQFDALQADFDRSAAALEYLRRPFAVTAETPHTDLWTFAPVQPYAGKHPCEKPAAMLEHIITASTRPGAVVFDAFMGTGSTGIASVKLGRNFIGCEMAAHHFADSQQRIADAMPQPANDNAVCNHAAAA
ncbi:site-specific DNA-methyltransferase [Bradyrhizobium sp. BWC-3-1]|uniref:DNA-methyltransferase n=1 Tax=Bradyrhizobium sp. BWC-3-1 TaxID=3080012 RepID=UPI00293E8BEA|nr:site-specific DNA-methyltransferase [Bradyrhizobium sp. BWC-3-1]WOH61917.1 site-specific DNA-methyltransferase [Bradyrhizobium sp. BWC-3-1]